MEIDTPVIPDLPTRWLAGLCNAGTPGGKLRGQLDGLNAAAAGAQPGRLPVAVRASEFPAKSPKSEIARQFAAMLRRVGGAW